MRNTYVLLLILLSGCMTTTGSGDVKRHMLMFQTTNAPPQAGWKKVVTPEYELITDLDPALTERAALLLSQSLAGLKAMFGRAPIAVERKITVIAMADTMEYERRFGKKSWGFSVATWDELFICVYGPPDRWFTRSRITFEATHSMILHALAHAVLHRYFPKQSMWFTEGLALYLETYRWLDAETLILGHPNTYAQTAYRSVRSINITDMLAWKSADQRDLQLAGLDGQSWAFVQYARNRETKTFTKFLTSTAELGSDAAFELHFGGRYEELDKEIFAFLRQNQFQLITLRVPPAEPAVVAIEPAAAEEVEQRLKALETVPRER